MQPVTKDAMVAALVPAAGASRRMGTDKRRLTFRGATVLEVTLATLRDAGLSPLVVVLEPESPCLELPGLAGADDVQVAINAEPERGMLSSIRAGLSLLCRATSEAGRPDLIGVAVQPGDHPFAPAEAVATLRATFVRDRPLLLRPRYRGRAGHPLFIHRSLFEAAAACDDAIGLRQLVRQRRSDVAELSFDEAGAETAEDDLDQPSDLEKLHR